MDRTIIDWIDIDRHSILNDRVLMQAFVDDYRKLFNQNLEVGCRACIDNAYNRITNYKNIKMANKSGYVLKEKYSGTIWKGRPIRNGDLSEELGKELLENHPARHNLFDSLPKGKTDLLRDTQLTLSELRKRHPKVKATSKATFLKELAKSEEEE